MRIGLLAPPWLPVPPAGYGGTEAVVDVLARGLARRGHDVVVFTTGDATVPVERLHHFAAAMPDRMDDAEAEREQVRRGYAALADCDVIHDHTARGPAWAIEHGLRNVVTTCHGPFDSTLHGVFVEYARHLPVIAISRNQAARVHAQVATVIHHGLDLDAFPVGPGGGGYLAFVGRMNPDKGVAEAIDIARTAGWPLRLAAKMREPLELAYFRDVVKPRLGQGAEFVGELDHAGKVGLLGGADALLNPLRWPEPFGLVMIESLGCGTPVLARPIGSVPEIVDHGRTGFIWTDDGRLAAGVAATVALDRADCRAAAEERFSSDRMVDEHLALYARVLAGTVSRAG